VDSTSEEGDSGGEAVFFDHGGDVGVVLGLVDLPEGAALGFGPGDGGDEERGAGVSALPTVASPHPVKPDVVVGRGELLEEIAAENVLMKGAGRVKHAAYSSGKMQRGGFGVAFDEGPFGVGGGKAFPVQGDPPRDVGDHVCGVLARHRHETFQPVRLVERIVIRGHDVGVWVAFQSGDDLFVSAQVIAVADG
jgi:hypothetical protein